MKRGLQAAKVQAARKRGWEYQDWDFYDAHPEERLWGWGSYYDAYPEELPVLDDWARIRSLCDRATGQPPGGAREYLRRVLDYAPMVSGLRDVIAAEYPWLLSKFDWVGRHDIDGNPLKPVQSRQLTDEQRKLVNNHLYLVERLAKRGFNEAHRADVERVGLDALEEQARRFDPARRVPFEAFARQRIKGAMLNYFRGNRVIDDQPHGRRVRQARTSSGGRRAKNLGRALQPTRLIKTKPMVTELREALAKLTDAQRIVYEGRTADPPKSYRELADQLNNVTRSAVQGLERRAFRRMAQLLKPR
jgi:RNA polymerase sigma factor (sigma-70 family)